MPEFKIHTVYPYYYRFEVCIHDTQKYFHSILFEYKVSRLLNYAYTSTLVLNDGSLEGESPQDF